jgi:deoxycytidine triphosphate deaminase
MLMNDVEILHTIERKDLVIEPFENEKLKGASYDLSLGEEALLSNRDQKVLLGAGSATNLTLDAGDFALVLTKELVKLPLNMAGSIGMRSTLARQGLILLHGMQIDPGFEGHLRFGLYNASPRRITLDYADDICMVEFHKLASNSTKTPLRNEDLIRGRIPENDKQFLRALETTSLSSLAQEMRTMSMSVKDLTTQVTAQAATLNTYIYPFIIAIVVLAFGIVFDVLYQTFKH